MTATIRVMSAGAVEPMVHALGAEFAKASGHKLDLIFNTAGALRERVNGGDVPDLLILSAVMMQAMDEAGLFVPGTRVDLGRTVTGVAVRAGAPAPDISTPDAFRQALLSARSVAYTDPKSGGTSGTYFANILDRLGIADAINAKAVLGKRGYEVARAVGDGRAEIGTTFISEMLAEKDVRVIGPLPGWMANTNTYAAAIPASSRAREGAAALLRALTDPASAPRWTAAGLEPAFAAA